MKSKFYFKIIALLLMFTFVFVFFACDEKDNDNEQDNSGDEKYYNISFACNPDVNVGLKKDNTYDPNATAESFVYGDVSYACVAGGIGGGTWSNGTVGLGQMIPHNFISGKQIKAVGVTTATNLEDVSFVNTGCWNTKDGKMAIKANGNGAELDPSTVEHAVANQNYVYLFLGVQPTKELAANKLIVLVDSSSTNVGLLAAFHVAYRINGSEWIDIDVFGNYHYLTRSNDVVINLNESQLGSYIDFFGVETPPTTEAQAAVIDLSDIAANTSDLAQIELVVYIAGPDSDCVTAGLNATGDINIFFHTVVADNQIILIPF